MIQLPLLVGCSIFKMVPGAMSGCSLEVIRGEYVAADDRGKRDCVIRAIDSGFIRVGGPLQPVQGLCDGTSSETYTHDGSTITAFSFQSPEFPPPDSEGRAMAPRAGGWMLFVAHKGGRITSLSLREPYSANPCRKIAQHRLEDLIVDYAKSRTSCEKRNVVLKAIDAELLGTLANLRAICGADFTAGAADEIESSQGSVQMAGGPDADCAGAPCLAQWSLRVWHDEESVMSFELVAESTRAASDLVGWYSLDPRPIEELSLDMSSAAKLGS